MIMNGQVFETSSKSRNNTNNRIEFLTIIINNYTIIGQFMPAIQATKSFIEQMMEGIMEEETLLKDKTNQLWTMSF